MFNRQKFNERVQEEFAQFRNQTLKLSKEEIFEKGFEIDFKTYITQYLTNEETASDKTCEMLNNSQVAILDVLFDIYLNNNTFYTYQDICEEIIELFEDVVDLDGVNNLD